MRFRLLCLAVLIACVFCASLAPGQWGAAGCLPVGRRDASWMQSFQPQQIMPVQLPVQAGPKWEWHRIGDTTQWGQFRDGVQVGWFDSQRDVFRTYDSATKTWGEEQSPAPWNAAAKSKEATKPPIRDQPVNNQSGPIFGMENDKLSKDAEVFELNGRMIEAGEIPDLRNRPFLTVVAADEAKRKKVVDELRTSEFGTKGWQIQGLKPDHFHMIGHKLDKDAKYQSSQFAVFAQAPVDSTGFGKMLDASYEWEGAEAYARKVDPNYDPSKNKSGGGFPSVPGLSDIEPASLAIIGALALIVFLPSKNRS